MKRARVIAGILSLCLIPVVVVFTSSYIHRLSAVQQFPSLQEEPSRPTNLETYIKLPPTEVERLLADNCEMIHLAEELPDPVKNAFATITGDKPFALANPGARFNATDVIEAGLPRRRLVIGGHCENRWFIEYEHGGIGKSIALMILRANSDGTVTFVWGRALKRRARSVEQLRALVARQAYWDGPYWW